MKQNKKKSRAPKNSRALEFRAKNGAKNRAKNRAKNKIYKYIFTV